MHLFLCIQILLFASTSLGFERKSDLEFSQFELLIKHGYPLEEHRIQTEDGYVLKTFRIPHGLFSNRTNKKPVILGHGIYTLCEIFLALGPKRGLGYVLADEGYDVWLMNARGNTYSRNHINLIANHNKTFWDFSFHELGYYDLAANIDYVLEKTGQKKVFYIGISQGGTIYYALTSTRPEYNDKIKAAVNMAPAIFHNYNASSTVKAVSDLLPIIQTGLRFISWYDFLPPPLQTGKINKYMCGRNSISKTLCSMIAQIVVGTKSPYVDDNDIPSVIEGALGGGSTFQAIHYLQNVKLGYFGQYDFGMMKNLLKYKSLVPPMYNLSKSTAPNLVMYAKNDIYSPKKTIQWMKQLLPNARFLEQNLTGFTHLDFIIASKVKNLIYNNLLEYLDSFDV